MKHSFVFYPWSPWRSGPCPRVCTHSAEPSLFKLPDTGCEGHIQVRCSQFLSPSSLGGTSTDIDNEVIIITSCLITVADFWERTKITWHSWQVLCTFTIAVIIFSVIMNGSYCQIPLPITFGYTTSPSEILWSIFKVMSAEEGLSHVGTVFSNHSTEGVWKGSRTRGIRCWALL